MIDWWDFFTRGMVTPSVGCASCEKPIDGSGELVVVDARPSLGKVVSYCVTCATFVNRGWKP